MCSKRHLGGIMNVGDYLLATIERIARRIILAREPLCLTGEVTATAPLRIRVKNYELSEDHIVLDVRCTEQWIKIPKDGANEHTHGCKEALPFIMTGATAAGPVTFTCMPKDPTQPTPEPGPKVDFTHKHEIETALPEICLWRGLRVGDLVRIIRLEGGAVHWVTGRIEDNIANDSKEDGGTYGTA